MFVSKILKIESPKYGPRDCPLPLQIEPPKSNFFSLMKIVCLLFVACKILAVISCWSMHTQLYAFLFPDQGN